MSSAARNIFKLIGLPVACIAMFIVVGGHFAIYQSVAWAQMVWTYSQSTGSIAQAVSDTFDGKHPCAMCKRIVKTHKEQDPKKHSLRTIHKRMLVWTEGENHRVVAPILRQYTYPYHTEPFYTVRSKAPDAPIPIAS
jgi:hypothetical protein